MVVSFCRRLRMSVPEPSTRFLSAVALVCAGLAGFAIFESKAESTTAAREVSRDITASIKAAALPKRRPIQAAAGWGEMSPQRQQTAHEEQ
jgi:hypothetical protein